ncbi:class Ib ribonucleoside-diphosphate reductase assembly flavoprotein NrdI [Paenibacillus alvei]|uniref:class Ib ribonucleoside-diphosphate reductase assembly flavoprotein NrdI n=1 Tax=Paenibacillus alvei TaxID=44250 RepID=UPI0018CFBAE7|nr:class Ib ribonucleoside-diphosphate reductase assembly flavoprotein NrdI [Paenibacillus alvei]MBG9736455.1 ribonucleotide reductase stimulatory protein [Paenibacillus alvei]MBG9736485.1 ribonucleotide reductase stimulatory protein [Paenibacillus alvei]MBG9736515.1 ribonucleotide reductase stimulatory protein [Paenibacillus alvei]MBG9736596.1 ribonucleotide reductase stimulatory protein [Paenibacillus alvei]MBG9745580.1 ribonucleotide reductase stimulatory protein [Paenibacillus alvei]
MKVVYYSLVGNVRRFLAKTGLPAQPIGDYDMYEPFVIVTNTLGFGVVPEPVGNFLERNGRNLVGVASSGNRNWGKNFGKAADIIGKMFDVPVLLKFELSGTDDDVRIFTERMREIDETYRTE